DHPNGLLDFVVVESIRHIRASGMKGVGLNFATMRAVLAGESGDGLAQRVERWVLRRMSDSMQIESLWRFNAKFDPDWQPRYAVYDAPEHMLPAAIAVARAESFWELPIIGRFLKPDKDGAEVHEPVGTG
ncbi:MAG: lysyl-tRNA synthetase, class, partial [Acidimicrobiaceae bacterium]|nr:lysyl-tRNA synthetase, class [Acidimicrobiaceae bacterium]